MLRRIQWIGFPAGLLGSVLALFGFVMAVFAAQLAVSALWLRRFRYGPLEWALRRLTNARRPALLVPPAAQRAGITEPARANTGG